MILRVLREFQSGRAIAGETSPLHSLTYDRPGKLAAVAKVACVSTPRSWWLVDVGSVENHQVAATPNRFHRLPFPICHLFRLEAALGWICGHWYWRGHTVSFPLSQAPEFKLNDAHFLGSWR